MDLVPVHSLPLSYRPRPNENSTVILGVHILNFFAGCAGPRETNSPGCGAQVSGETLQSTGLYHLIPHYCFSNTGCIWKTCVYISICFYIACLPPLEYTLQESRAMLPTVTREPSSTEQAVKFAGSRTDDGGQGGWSWIWADPRKHRAADNKAFLPEAGEQQTRCPGVHSREPMALPRRVPPPYIAGEQEWQAAKKRARLALEQQNGRHPGKCKPRFRNRCARSGRRSAREPQLLRSPSTPCQHGAGLL